MSATYSISHYQAISKVESEHFWFRARTAMIALLVNAFIPGDRRRSFLEVGCGTGIVLSAMRELGFRVTGLDVNQTALTYAKKSCPSARLIRKSLYSFIRSERFQTIGAFDVLEHQSRDALFLKRCYDLLEEGGMLFLTVPAGMWLWSNLDVLSGHKRRYEAGEIRKKLERVGFHVQFINYWNVLTLPLYIFYRNYVTTESVDAYLRTPNGFINTLLYYVLRLEQLFFFTFPFPCGATLVVCAKK